MKGPACVATHDQAAVACVETHDQATAARLLEDAASEDKSEAACCTAEVESQPNSVVAATAVVLESEADVVTTFAVDAETVVQAEAAAMAI